MQSCQERETIYMHPLINVIALISIYDTACVYANINYQYTVITKIAMYIYLSV